MVKSYMGMITGSDIMAICQHDNRSIENDVVQKDFLAMKGDCPDAQMNENRIKRQVIAMQEPFERMIQRLF
jgi:hypothetical protein